MAFLGVYTRYRRRERGSFGWQKDVVPQAARSGVYEEKISPVDTKPVLALYYHTLWPEGPS